MVFNRNSRDRRALKMPNFFGRIRSRLGRAATQAITGWLDSSYSSGDA